MFDPTGMGGGARGPAPPLQKRSENSPEDMCREMEKEVNALIEDSATLAYHKEAGRALDKAKEAGKGRMEGKDYVMADGDVVEFRFNV